MRQNIIIGLGVAQPGPWNKPKEIEVAFTKTKSLLLMVLIYDAFKRCTLNLWAPVLIASK